MSGTVNFLATADLGRAAGPPVASETSEWEDMEREERLALLTEDEERIGGLSLFFLLLALYISFPIFLFLCSSNTFGG